MGLKILNPRVSQRHPLIKFHFQKTTKNKYSGTPLIRSPTGKKKMAVLSRQAQIS